MTGSGRGRRRSCAAPTRATDVKTAQRLLLDLARRLETEYPSAAESVREGLDETLTVLTLNLSARLRRSLATTNAAESLLSRTRHVKRNVKRWRGGQMMLRWVAAGVLEAVKGFRRLKGYADMPKLVAALRARDQQLGLSRRSGGATDRVVVNRAAAEFQQPEGHPPGSCFGRWRPAMATERLRHGLDRQRQGAAVVPAPVGPSEGDVVTPSFTVGVRQEVRGDKAVAILGKQRSRPARASANSRNHVRLRCNLASAAECCTLVNP